MLPFTNKLSIRQVDIQGENNWLWPIEDVGAFGDATDGPMHDWISSHSTKYFEYLNNRRLVVTAGACGGMHVRFYAKEFQSVYAFEPDPISFYCMSGNAPYPNVYKFNAAVSDTCGQVRLAVNDTTNIGTHHITKDGIAVQSITIDSLNLPECDLIQLDVEGHETAAIRGAVATINKFSPVVIAERMPYSPLLDSMGYIAVDQSMMDTIFVRKAREV